MHDIATAAAAAAAAATTAEAFQFHTWLKEEIERGRKYGAWCRLRGNNEQGFCLGRVVRCKHEIISLG